MARPFISERQDLRTQDHIIKLNMRCDNMGKTGAICPDGGDPTTKYVKDIGMTRRLYEQQVSHNFILHPLRMQDMTGDISETLKSKTYMSMIDSKINDVQDRRARQLHIIHETIDFVDKDRLPSFPPIIVSKSLYGAVESTIMARSQPMVWLGEGQDRWETAKHDLTRSHIIEYRQGVEGSSQICEPTTYMKAHFPKDSVIPFGIFVDEPDTVVHHARRPEEISRYDLPPDPPPPKNEDIYENWATFG